MPVPTAFTDDRASYRGEVSEFLAAASSSSSVRRLMETTQGYDPSVWQEMIDLGFVGRHLPSRHGGGGATAVDLGILMEEMGAVLACSPMLSTVAATCALLGPSHEPGPGKEASELLAALVGGHRLATMAVTGDSGLWTEDAVAVTASRSGRASSWRLNGHASYVLDGHVADVVIVAARTGGGTSLFLVEVAAKGFSRQLLDTVDQTRRLARLELSSTPAVRLGERDEAWPVVTRVLDLCAAALASEQAGGAGRCLEMSVAYARERVQFGRPIGSFQAIAHRSAEMLLEVESARVAARHACRSAACEPESFATAASMAKVCCSDAYAWVATETIQVHGGLGFTWDHDAHLYFRRAKSSRLLFGDPQHHRERLARRLLTRGRR